MKCLFCDNKDLTAEHGLKKSEIKEADFDNFKAFSLKRKKVMKIQGPNSSILKFDPSICSKCNNEVSQKGDIAFSNFNKEVMNGLVCKTDFVNNSTIEIPSFDQIEEVHKIHFKLAVMVYKAPILFKDNDLFVRHKNIDNIYSYFAKIMACCINKEGVPVPKNLKYIFKGQNPKKIKKHTGVKLFVLKTGFDGCLYPQIAFLPGEKNQSHTTVSLIFQIEPNISYLFICEIKKTDSLFINKLKDYILRSFFVKTSYDHLMDDDAFRKELFS